MPDIPSKFQKDPSITVRVIAWTHRQTKTGKNIISLAEVNIALFLPGFLRTSRRNGHDGMWVNDHTKGVSSICLLAGPSLSAGSLGRKRNRKEARRDREMRDQ